MLRPCRRHRPPTDYVLWGADGKPLGVVEANRARKDPREGKHQAKLYADCLEAMFGQRPVIFYTNGYDHWIWDDTRYPPRAIQGFLTRDELALIVKRRTGRLPLARVATDRDIAGGGGRTYQERAIRAVCHRFEDHDRGGEHQRKALLVMATGSGKTRTVIALADVMMRANWAKRVLFLADRVPLVAQATNAFRKHLPDCATVNLWADASADGRVFVATYPTMLNLIERARADGRQRFGPGFFNMVVIDEAHRSVYRKYRAIFDWFDAPLVGLTATPKDEVDKNTYDLFELESGVPTDAYDLKQAVAEEFLVPPRARHVPTKFPLDGIRYDDLSEEEKEAWDAAEWGEDGLPDSVEPSAVNDWLFNTDTIDKMLEQLIRDGQRVDDGETLGKTIIFAKNHRHAEFIVERFDASYPHLKGRFCQLVDNQVKYAHALIDRFADAADMPQIAVGRHARYRDRHPRDPQPRLLQDRSVEIEIPADGRARHAAVPRDLRGRGRGPGRQAVLLRLRLSRQFRFFQRAGRAGRCARRCAAGRTAVHRARRAARAVAAARGGGGRARTGDRLCGARTDLARRGARSADSRGCRSTISSSVPSAAMSKSSRHRVPGGMCRRRTSTS